MKTYDLYNKLTDWDFLLKPRLQLNIHWIKIPFCLKYSFKLYLNLSRYIYTDNINISSFDKACELCYGAKKYMLPHLVKECTRYLWSDLYPRNACRAYEFARLFEENVLMDKCIQVFLITFLIIISYFAYYLKFCTFIHLMYIYYIVKCEIMYKYYNIQVRN